MRTHDNKHTAERGQERTSGRADEQTSGVAQSHGYSSSLLCCFLCCCLSHADVFERRLSGSEHPLQVQEKIRKHGNLDHFKLVFRPVTAEDEEREMEPSAGVQAPEQTQTPGVGDGSAAAGGATTSVDVDAASVDSEEDDLFGNSSTSIMSPPAAARPTLPHSGSTFSYYASSRTLLGPVSGSTGAGGPQQPNYVAQIMNADPSIIRCGYLDKRGKRNTAWKERWFVLRMGSAGSKGTPPSLSYYKSHLPQSPIATILLTEAFVRPLHTACCGLALSPFAAAPSITNLTISPPLPTPHAHSSLSKCSAEFEIDTVLRVYNMRARSYPEMRNWVYAVDSLLSVCADNVLIDTLQLQIEEQEFAECDKEEKRLAHIMTLQGLLKDAIGIEQFVQFETENHSEENVLFYLESQGYYQASVEGSKPKSHLLERARGIFDNFLAAGAEQEIHCASESRNTIRAAIDAGDVGPNLFQGIQKSVFTLLQAGSFANFLQSKHFQRAMHKLVRLYTYCVNAITARGFEHCDLRRSRACLSCDCVWCDCSPSSAPMPVPLHRSSLL